MSKPTSHKMPLNKPDYWFTCILRHLLTWLLGWLTRKRMIGILKTQPPARLGSVDIYIYIYTYIYTYMYMCIHACIHICIRLRILYADVERRMYTYTYTHTYTYIYICICICMYVYVFSTTCTRDVPGIHV